MRNRDYFAKPIQDNGRSRSDYGRTKLHVDDDRSKDRLWWAFILLVIALFTVRVLL